MDNNQETLRNGVLMRELRISLYRGRADDVTVSTQRAGLKILQRFVVGQFILPTWWVRASYDVGPRLGVNDIFLKLVDHSSSRSRHVRFLCESLQRGEHVVFRVERLLFPFVEQSNFHFHYEWRNVNGKSEATQCVIQSGGSKILILYKFWVLLLAF